MNPTEIGDIVFGDQKFTTAVAAGTGPDTAMQNRHTFLQFAAKGLYQDVTDRFDASDLNRDDYTPVQLNETVWEGKMYGLPWGTDVRYLYWNKDHFAEVGLDPDQPPTTWAELEEYTDKLNIRDGDDVVRYGFVPYLYGNSWMWLYGFLAGAPSLSDDKRTILCDDQLWIDTLQWMVSFYDNYVGDFELANSFQQGIQSAAWACPFCGQARTSCRPRALARPRPAAVARRGTNGTARCRCPPRHEEHLVLPASPSSWPPAPESRGLPTHARWFHGHPRLGGAGRGRRG